MVPKTFVFDKVLSTNAGGEGEESQLANAVLECTHPYGISHHDAGRDGSFCVISMGGLDRPDFGKDLGAAFENFLNYYQASDVRMKEDVCITVVEVIGEDGFRDLLEPPASVASPHVEKVHRLQSDSQGFVWVTDVMGVTIKSRWDFERVCRIVHERRSR